jgi:apolipoprotein N-acyltransferase
MKTFLDIRHAYPGWCALIAGVLLPLSLAPFGWWPLGMVSIGLWFSVARQNPEQAAKLGWLFGVGKFGVGVSWVYVSINVYGGASALLAGALVALFVSALALFSLLNGVMYARLRSDALLLDAALFACLFVAFEWLLTWVFTGFPWLFPAYGHLQTALAGFAPVGGVLLVSLALTLSSCFVVAGYLSVRKGWPLLAAVTPWLLGAALLQVTWVTPGEARSVALIQGNVDQALKWLPESQVPIIDTYLRLSEPHWGVDTIVWPEAAITLMAHRADSILEKLQQRGEAHGTSVVVGLPAIEKLPEGGAVFRNTALAIGDGSGRYVKRRLVPFGEYVPLESSLRGLIGFFDLPMSHAAPGAWRQPLLRLNGDSAAVAICYEIVYPELVRAQAVGADVLITLSNDSWFGASIGPLQHLQMAQMRSLENGRWLLRDTNNGVTAIVDHRGRVAARLPQFQEGALVGEYQIMHGSTLFSRMGNWPVLGLLALGLVAGVWRRYMG